MGWPLAVHFGCHGFHCDAWILIVSMSFRILQEEFDRRDQLEKLQDEMKNSLEAERKCREELELKHQEQLEQMK